VHQFVGDLDGEAVTHEYAEAIREYCATLTIFTEQVRSGEELSLDQMDQVEAAQLRFENARTLCELYVCGGLDPLRLRPPQSPARLPA
jgi:hypothetical protein